MDVTYSVTIMDGSWTDEDSSLNPALNFGSKSWDDVLTLTRWATEEEYEVSIQKESGVRGGG
ncbi:MAG: hypothetical protein E7437_05370 [Ruminococcaceae bacterium]|nr:hypothetical protein [Oscillospiraceae bacterium]